MEEGEVNVVVGEVEVDKGSQEIWFGEGEGEVARTIRSKDFPLTRIRLRLRRGQRKKYRRIYPKLSSH